MHHQRLVGIADRSKEASPAEAFLESMGGDITFKSLKLKEADIPEVLMKDGSKADISLIKSVITAYAGQYRRTKEFEVKRITAADEMVKRFDQDSFLLAIQKLYDKLGVTNAPILLFFVRYANGTLFRELLKATKGQWHLENSVNMGYLFNDSREAMIMADRQHRLGDYAALRGIKEEEIIDKYFSDFGFDEQGIKRYDLGGCVIRVTLQPDLTLTLFNETTEKPVKMLPKKDTDEIKRNTAADDLADLRKNIKRVTSIKGNRLLACFLSGEEMNAPEWKTSYLGNPFLRALARLLVWQQGDSTFTIRDSVPADSAGQAYEVNEQPIRVAHPMEMQPADITAWQKYFAENGLKQLFEQIWEPVHTPDDIKPERYEGAIVPAKYLLHRQKQGIDLYIYEFDYGNYGGTDEHFSLKDCEISYELLGSDEDQWDEPVSERYSVKLGRFTFAKYNRQVNHIVYLMDRVTVRDRIAKDDISVMAQLTAASLPQITEYLSIAADSNAVNVTAALLEYKNTHFAEIDPMAEFTLDW